MSRTTHFRVGMQVIVTFAFACMLALELEYTHGEPISPYMLAFFALLYGCATFVIWWTRWGDI